MNSKHLSTNLRLPAMNNCHLFTTTTFWGSHCVIGYLREEARPRAPRSWRNRSRCRAWTSRRSRPRRTTAGRAPAASPISSSSPSPPFCGSVPLLKSLCSWKVVQSFFVICSRFLSAILHTIKLDYKDHGHNKIRFYNVTVITNTCRRSNRVRYPTV